MSYCENCLSIVATFYNRVRTVHQFEAQWFLQVRQMASGVPYQPACTATGATPAGASSRQKTSGYEIAESFRREDEYGNNHG
jgi:hypothetical protein